MTTRDGAWARLRAAWTASAPPAELRREAEDRLRAGDLDGAHARARNSPLLHLRVHLALLRAGAGGPLPDQLQGLRAAAGAPISSTLRRLQGVPPTAPPSPGLLRRAQRGPARSGR